MHRFDVGFVAFNACMSALLLSPRSLGAQSGAPAISGIVVERSGAAIPFAYVFVRGGSTAVAHGDGQFRIANDGTDRIVIGVRRIGYAPLDTTINSATERPQGLRLEMSRVASQIDTVLIKASGS